MCLLCSLCYYDFPAGLWGDHLLCCLTYLFEVTLHSILLNLSIHSAMDAFAQTLMKDAVNCDKHSDLQNSVNQLDFEYGLCCKGFLCKHTCSIYLVLCTALCLC